MENFKGFHPIYPVNSTSKQCVFLNIHGGANSCKGEGGGANSFQEGESAPCLPKINPVYIILCNTVCMYGIKHVRSYILDNY